MKPNLLFLAVSFAVTFGCGSDVQPKSLPNAVPAEPSDSSGTSGGDASGQTVSITNCYKAEAEICAIEAEIVRLTNTYRTAALIQNFASSFVARDWSNSQAKAGQISHEGFPAARKKVLLAEFPDAKWSFSAENVAMLQSNETDGNQIAQQLVTMWYNSEGHRINMLGNYRSIGVGVTKLNNSYYATQIFY